MNKDCNETPEKEKTHFWCEDQLELEEEEQSSIESSIDEWGKTIAVLLVIIIVILLGK
jgi:hypothetical protein